MEIFVRVSIEKFVPNKTTQVSDAVMMSINEHVKKKFPAGRHAAFRWEKLWNTECANVFWMNKDNIDALKVSLYKQRSKNNKLALGSVFSMMTIDTDMGLKEPEVAKCFSIAKMTVAEEELEGVNSYNTAKPVELMEYIGRCADLKFPDED
jgi:hypothetical protein